MKEKSKWPRVAFGDVVKLNKDRVRDPVGAGVERYVGLEHLTPGDLRVRRWGNVADGTTFTNAFKPGQVLFGKRRAYQRKVAVADFTGVCSGDIYVFEPKDDRLLPELLPFICQTERFFEHAVGTSAGSLSPRTNWTQLTKYEFALPPLDEQRRVGRMLKGWERLKTATQLARNKAWIQRISFYQHVTQCGIHQDRDLKESQLGLIPIDWSVEKVGSVVQIENQLRKPLSASVRAKMQGDYDYWGATGILDAVNEFRFNGTYALIGEDGDHFLKQGSQSMTHLVSGRFNVNNHAHAIAGTDLCTVDWFFHYFRHRDIRQWLTKQGSGRMKLKKSDLMQARIAIPPMTEQLKLTELLEQVTIGSEILENRVKTVKKAQKDMIRCTLES